MFTRAKRRYAYTFLQTGPGLINEQHLQTHQGGRLGIVFVKIQLGLHVRAQVEEGVDSHRRDFCACYPLHE